MCASGDRTAHAEHCCTDVECASVQLTQYSHLPQGALSFNRSLNRTPAARQALAVQNQH